ncbi:unnamed protein product [Sphagnum jensenii]|uniref:Uncharacterized protein n=1 Tax=Sphagnum jensenii TaxID=128206 RepID=A0ABP0WJN3_9BRYO
MTEMATRVRAQNSTAAPRHEAQIPNMHRGGEASKHPRNQISVPTTRIDLAKIRPSSLSSDPERRSTSAGDPDNRMAIDPTPSPSRAEGGTRANDKKPPTGATTPRNSIFFELPSSDCPKAQSTAPRNGDGGESIKVQALNQSPSYVGVVLDEGIKQGGYRMYHPGAYRLRHQRSEHPEQAPFTLEGAR